ncbi:hypothetical protein [[Mycobacterium] wendilense]|uniref:Immunity protein 63 domain-containing protein n=1 Tax=[Mycobacterium] wendilense TaxID=3064284 RepID=A0ABN9P795_9MYCO|nr:hypothetical protein [Mycolicibacterium sp. MU0050]CAJ1586169.1 hypothetical protein MU0050_004126 [Mycolicibacterium sp. MU0050]
MRNDEFVIQAQEILGPTLSGRGFTLEEIDDAVDEGGRYGAALYYLSSDCKLQIYWSAREWEVNVMVAPLGSPNQHGLYDRSRRWHYLPEFSPRPNLSLEELVKKRREEGVKFLDDIGQLRQLVGHIDRYFEKAHTEILKQYGQEPLDFGEQ